MKRTPLKRSGWLQGHPRKRIKRRKKPRRVSVLRDPARRRWARTRPCVGSMVFDGHQCGGYTDERPSNEPSHIRDFTGAGMQPGDDRIVTKCPTLHDHWEQRYGWFDGWTNEQRKAWAEPLIQAHNAAWEARVAGLIEGMEAF